MSEHGSPTGPEAVDVRSASFTDRIGEAARAKTLLVSTDFDGTIAPFMDDPQAVTPLPEAIASLVGLATLPGTTVALVSGRDLATLGRLAGHPAGAVLVGSHGAESSDRDIAGAGTLTREQATLLDEIAAAAGELTERYEGLTVERKTAAVGVHVRQVADASREPAMREADQMIRERFGLAPMLGKNVVEAAVLSATKGHALAALAAKVGADAIVYLGDDVTDETVFTQFAGHDGALMIKIGAGDTAGTTRLEGTADAAQALVMLHERRAEATT